MKNLNLVATNAFIDDFDIDEVIKNDPDIYVNAADPELQCSKFLFAIRKLEEEMENFKLNAEKMINEVNEWLEKKLQHKQTSIDFMASYIRNYLIKKSLKSLSLPAGNVGFRKQPDKVEIIDPDKFFEHATFDLIRVVPEKFEPDLVAIKARIKEKGEIPVGVDLVTPEPKFYYKLNKKGDI